jgi:hypothetical protein
MTPVSRADLSGVLVKIERAKAHLSEFERRARRVEDACRNAIVRERDEQRSEYVFRFKRVPGVPPVLSAIIGDAVHNLRVSLDHLAWQLVIVSGGKPDDNTTFPILEVPPTPNRYGRIRVQISPGVTKEIGRVLDEIQPYKRTKPAHHELAILHRLDISDKHRELLVTVVGVRFIGWFGETNPTGFNPGPYEDGTEVCRFPFSSPNFENQLNPVMTFSIRLNEPAAGPWRLMLGAAEVVRQSLRYIENEVLPRFRGYF